MKALKALEKPLGFFLYPLKALKKAVGKFLPNRWKRWKKPLGSFPLPVESAEESRWENSSYPLLQRRKLTYLRFRLDGYEQRDLENLIFLSTSIFECPHNFTYAEVYKGR